jgi:glutamate transport system permease protein
MAIDHLGLYAYGLLVTLKICAAAAGLSLAIGVVICICRISPVRPLRIFGAVWVTCFQSCPLAVILFFLAFGLPVLGITWSYLLFGLCGLVCYTSAFAAEAVRSGINSVDDGLIEAAYSLGFSFTRVLLLVVLPIGVRSAIPPLVNVYINMIKNAAVVGAFGVTGELFGVTNSLISAQGYPAIPVLTGVVIGYFLLIMPLVGVLRVAERRLVVVR